MERYIYSVEKVAELIDVHQKTVHRYIKEGKLQAKKVGGRWRIHGNDLSSFVGYKDNSGADTVLRQMPKADVTPAPWVSTVVNAENIGMEESIRIANTLMAVTNSNMKEDKRCRVDTVYFEEDLKIQILIWGSIDFNVHLLKILGGLTK